MIIWNVKVAEDISLFLIMSGMQSLGKLVVMSAMIFYVLWQTEQTSKMLSKTL